MEVRIGIQHHPREISFESTASAEELHTSIESALSQGQALLRFSDAKGKQYLVPSAAIAYLEFGSETSRRVGFVN